MTLPSYQIVVIDTSGTVQRIFGAEQYDEIRYSRILNGIGRIAMTLRDTEDWGAVFALDNFIEVYRTSPVTGALQKEETYMARLWHHYVRGDEGFWVVGGVSLNHLLKRRIVDPADDPAAAGGYSTKGGDAGAIMEEYIDEQAGSSASAARQFPNFTISRVGTAQSAGWRARHDNLLELIQRLADKGEIDFVIERTTDNNLVCYIQNIGSDKTIDNAPAPYVGISPERGNIRDPSYSEDRIDEANYVYALGAGQGTNRVLLTIPSDQVTDSPYNRVEYVHDARNSDYTDALALLTEGQSSLEERRGKKEFTFEITAEVPGTEYNLDWILGDRITGIWESIEENLRVTGVEITLSADGETIVPILENI